MPTFIPRPVIRVGRNVKPEDMERAIFRARNMVLMKRYIEPELILTNRQLLSLVNSRGMQYSVSAYEPVNGTLFGMKFTVK